MYIRGWYIYIAYAYNYTVLYYIPRVVERKEKKGHDVPRRRCGGIIDDGVCGRGGVQETLRKRISSGANEHTHTHTQDPSFAMAVPRIRGYFFAIWNPISVLQCVISRAERALLTNNNIGTTKTSRSKRRRNYRENSQRSPPPPLRIH